MSAETDALQAAAAQLYAYMQEDKRSNTVIIHGEDVGPVDHITIQPTPAVAAWSDDLVVITHVAQPSTAATPGLKVSDLPEIPITLPSGGALIPGDAQDIAVFKIEGTGTAQGPRARLMFLGPAAMAARTLSVASGVGVEVDAQRKTNLDYAQLPPAAAQSTDVIALLRPAAGATPASYHQTSLGALAGLLGGLVGFEVIDASGPWPVPPGVRGAFAFVTGGGGAGGSSNGTPNLVGAGGEGGCTAFKFVDLSAVESVQVTIGPGGAPAAANAAPNSRAGDGGTTTFGAFASAPGGKGGWNSYGLGGPPAPTGTAGAVGDGFVPGNPGHGRQGDNAGGYWAGNGGSSFWGGAGPGADAQTPGAAGPQPGYAATGHGSGGGGGDDGGVGVGVQGGAGMHGVVALLLTR